MSYHTPSKTVISTVTLTVNNMEQQLHFYTDVIGLKIKHKLIDQVVLGTAHRDIVVLHKHTNAKQDTRTTGLFHLAILLPTREELASWLKHYLSLGYQLQGASDHGVSEALYLSDPEGNGIEMYTDHPRETWPFREDKIKMVTKYLDVQNLLEVAVDSFSKLSEQTTLGHIHLRVSDLKEARAFYVDLLGFDLMQDDYAGALFISAGGYHHHIGMNVWNSTGAAPPLPNTLGLHSYTIALSNKAELENLASYLSEAKYPMKRVFEGLELHDPSGLKIIFTRV